MYPFESLTMPAIHQTQDPIARLQWLEQAINALVPKNQQQPLCECQSLVDEYLDLGLEMAHDAGQKQRHQLQESWLKRVYKTLFKASLNRLLPDTWRSQCLESLYQPLFALHYLYLDQGQGEQKLRALHHELNVTTRCWL